MTDEDGFQEAGVGARFPYPPETSEIARCKASGRVSFRPTRTSEETHCKSFSRYGLFYELPHPCAYAAYG